MDLFRNDVGYFELPIYQVGREASAIQHQGLSRQLWVIEKRFDEMRLKGFFWIDDDLETDKS